MKLGFYPRLYRVQHVVVVGAEGLPREPPRLAAGGLGSQASSGGRHHPSSLLGTGVLTGHILGGDEPLLRPVLGRELGEGGEARVLSPHPRPGLHRASLPPPDQVQYELDCCQCFSVVICTQRNIGRSTSIHFIVS